MTRRFTALILLAACSLASAVSTPAAPSQSLQSQVNAILANAGASDAKLTLSFVDLSTGTELAAVKPDLALMPASNLKLITTAAALNMLGADYLFSTQLRLDGSTLIIKGDGDPGFGDPVLLEALGLDADKLLERWAAAVAKAGVKTVNIIVDDRVFDQQFLHPSWPENQVLQWYCAEVAGVNFNDNCLDVFASPTQPGKLPLVTTMPSNPAVTLDNQAKTGGSDKFWAQRKPDTNNLIIRGEIKHGLKVPISVTIHDPALWFAQTLAKRIKAAGVEVQSVDRLKPGVAPAQGQLLAEVRTTMRSVIQRANRDSQNLFAEALFKRCGQKLTGQPGSWTSGQAAVRQYLQKAVGAGAANVVIDDGSGLSRGNKISASAITKVLAQVAAQPALRDAYIESLAVPGGDGTLQRRFKGAKLNGQVRGKSGYIAGVISLSGYLLEGNKTIAFSMIVNDYKGNKSPKEWMEEIVKAVDARYGTPKSKPDTKSAAKD